MSYFDNLVKKNNLKDFEMKGVLGTKRPLSIDRKKQGSKVNYKKAKVAGTVAGAVESVESRGVVGLEGLVKLVQNTSNPKGQLKAVVALSKLAMSATNEKKIAEIPGCLEGLVT